MKNVKFRGGTEYRGNSAGQKTREKKPKFRGIPRILWALLIRPIVLKLPSNAYSRKH